ncbi:hypothetical protein NPIL_136561 [Nephila pilipes]|uniref:Uncharacterized protein n=1 Tax=Nephila pilipes TaxID=299642 RepID=A0A8X6TPT5_NEPPI|nr:hypothetical protein NPIL_136561 [Nephila pilipes]
MPELDLRMQSSPGPIYDPSSDPADRNFKDLINLVDAFEGSGSQPLPPLADPIVSIIMEDPLPPCPPSVNPPAPMVAKTPPIGTLAPTARSFSRRRRGLIPTWCPYIRTARIREIPRPFRAVARQPSITDFISVGRPEIIEICETPKNDSKPAASPPPSEAAVPVPKNLKAKWVRFELPEPCAGSSLQSKNLSSSLSGSDLPDPASDISHFPSLPGAVKPVLPFFTIPEELVGQDREH